VAFQFCLKKVFKDCSTFQSSITEYKSEFIKTEFLNEIYVENKNNLLLFNMPWKFIPRAVVTGRGYHLKI